MPFETWISDQVHLPTVALSSPIDGAHLGSGSATIVAADAHDPAGSKYGSAGGVVQVEFVVGNCSIGIDSTSPYSVSFSPPDGLYHLAAVVTDSDGNVATSAAVGVFVGNYPPEVDMISPPPLGNFVSGQAVAIDATATDLDGVVSQVEFFVGDVSIAVVTAHVSNVYSATWQPTTAGAYRLRAVATDGEGKTNPTSVHVTVDATISTSASTAVDDASLRQGAPTQTGDWGDVEIYGSPTGAIVGVFKFDLSAYTGTAQVRAATFKVYTASVLTGGEFSVFAAIGDDWSAASVTWSDGPSRGAKLTSVAMSSAGQYYEFDVTEFISGRVQASDSLVTLWLDNDSREYKKVEVESNRQDRSNPPQLHVTTSTIAIVADGGEATATDDCLFLAGPPRPPSAPPLPPSTPLPRLPPELSACSNSCMGTTCGTVSHLPCSHLNVVGCDCNGCCDATSALTPPNFCGVGTSWNAATRTCDVVCAAEVTRRLSDEHQDSDSSRQPFRSPVPQ